MKQAVQKGLSLLAAVGFAFAALPLTAAAEGEEMVTTTEDFVKAINNNTIKTIQIAADVTFDWGEKSYANSEALKLQNKTLVGKTGEETVTFKGYGSANPIKDCTMQNLKVKDETVGDNEGSWEHGYLEVENLTATGVVFLDQPQINGTSTLNDCTFTGTADFYAAWVNSGSAEFHNCEFNGVRSLKMHEAYGSDVTSVLVDGCTFTTTGKPGVVIGDLNKTTTVKIQNSRFVNCEAGDQSEYVYESDTDVTKFDFAIQNCVVCNGTKVEVPAKAATCTEAGNKQYWQYNVSGAHGSYLVNSGENNVNLYFSNEDCTEWYDGFPEEPAKGHTLTKYERVEPTCVDTGKEQYWECTVCHKLFDDAAAINETTDNALTIDHLGHDLKLVAEVKATTEAGGTLAHYECTRCDQWFWDKAATNPIANHDDVKISKLPEPVVEQGETKVDVGSEVTNKEVSQAAAESLKVTDTDALAGNVAKEAEKVNQDETLKNEAKEQFAALGIDVPTESITMIVKPFPQVTVTGDKDGILSMEINLAYTVDAVAGGKRVTVQSEPQPIDNKDIEHPTTISITLPEGYRDIQLVRHELSGNRGVKYYPVEIDENGVATFVVPAEDGFSPFTMARNQTVTVKLDGVQYTYSTMDTLDGGKALPALSKNNYLFKGWKFEGIENQHFTMTAWLFEELLDKNAVVVGSSVFEGPLSEHPEIEEAKKNGTWGVDENKPATTAKPAAAAVTPVRTSSIPKTSDDSNLMLWVCLMGIAALGMGGAVYMKKRNNW